MKQTIVIVICLSLIIISSSSALSKINWSPSTVLSSESNLYSYRGNIVIDSLQTLHFVWKDKSSILNSSSDWDLFYKYKKQNNTWSTTELITPLSINDSNCLSLEIDSNDTLHLAYKDQTDILNAGSDWDIFYKSKPFNLNWTQPVLISDLSTEVCTCPSITIDKDDTIHITWADTTDIYNSDKDSDIYYKKKIINQNWTDSELISKNSTNTSIDPDIAVDDYLTVHIVWYEKINGNFEILYTYQLNNHEWSEFEIVSTNCTDVSSDPTIAIDEKNNLHLIWVDKTNLFDNGVDYDIFYRFKPFGKNWETIEVLSINSISKCRWPFMIIDDNDIIHVAWADQTPYDNKQGDHDIVYLSKKADSSSWGSMDLVSTDSKYDSNWPQLIVDGNNTVHMTWWDEKPDEWITYYSYGNQEIVKDDIDAPSISFLYGVMLVLCIFLIRKKRKIKR